MTNANTPSGNEDLSTAPASDPIGGSGASTSDGSTTTDTAVDASPGNQDAAGDTDQNPPLPDWGPTDGEHGVDGDPQS